MAEKQKKQEARELDYRSLGFVLGIAIGVALGNIALGVIMGLLFGAALYERQESKKMRST